MKVCIISDTHIHPFTSFATGVGANNSRVQVSLNALDQVHTYCMANNIKHLIHAGDLFHARDHQRFPVFNAVADKLRDIAKDLFITLIVGNHDIVDREGTTSVHALNNIVGVEVITRPTVTSDGLLFIPYTANYEQLNSDMVDLLQESPKADWCIIAHLDVKGAEIGSAMHISEKGLPTDAFVRYKKVLLGHYHKCQQVSENTYYIGALTPVDFGDKNQEGRFCTLDTETGEVQWLTIKCPQFMELKQGQEFDAIRYKGNYVRVFCERSEAISAMLEDAEAKAFEFVPKPKEEVSVERIHNIEKMNWPELIDRYVSIKKPKNLNEDQLVKLGLELLK